MLDIDGSYLEGGGQILRTSLALSALTGQAFSTKNIRKGRPKPGLQPQHLYSVKAAQQLCNAKVSNAFVGSQSLEFIPGSIVGKDISIDVGTAGSLTLLLQSVLLPAAFADRPTRFNLTGGTDVPFSQPYDYFANVLLQKLKPFAEFEPELIRRGYYPKGGGKLSLTVKPRYSISDYKDFAHFFEHIRKSLPNMHLEERGKIISIKGISHASSNLKGKRVAERQAESARQAISALGYGVETSIEYSDSLGAGSGLTLWAASEARTVWPAVLGADSLGELGKPAERVGEEAARNLVAEIKSMAPVDRHLGDQLVPWAAFLPSACYRVSELTQHCRTNVYTVERFVPVRFEAKEGYVRLP